MDRQEYPTMVATLEPSQAISVLDDRVRQVGRINTDFADWLQERRRLEEQYAAGLRKLSKRPPPGDSVIDLGIFSVPWNTLTSSLETMAESHQVLAQRIEVDVERPLRDFVSTNRESQAMTTIQGNLASMAGDIENSQKKADRLARKGSINAGRAESELENAQSQWGGQAPYVFESLQALDEKRLNHLRDVLTQFQTHEVDAIEKIRTTAEQSLNVLLNVETADEIKMYAIRISSGDMLPKEKPRNRQSMFITPSLGSSSSPRVDDATSTRSGSASVDRPSEPEKKPKGLKRLSTVLGRKNKTVPRQGSESPERKSRASPFNSLSSRFGRGHQELPTQLEESEEFERPDRRPSSALRTITSYNSNHSSNGNDGAPIDGSAMSLAAAGMAPEPSRQPESSRQQHSPAPPQQMQEPLQPAQPSQPSLLPPIQTMQPMQPIQPVQTSELPRDNEGFSEPPPAADAISQAEQEAAEANEASQPQFKLDIRNAPITEEGGEAALTNVVNTLRMQAPPPTSRRAGTVRGRRSMYIPSPVSSSEPPIQETVPSVPPPMQPIQTQPIEETRAVPEIAPIMTSAAVASPSSPTISSPTFGNSTFSPFHGSAQAVAANIFRPGSRIGDEVDTGSIRSGRSLGSTTSQSHKHPELHEAGLNSSIIETVSASFEQGQLTRSVTIGEIALAYNPTDLSSSFGTELIRLDNFSNLEKVAPNPAFLTADNEHPGEYSVNLGSITKTAVAFKYQVASTNSASAPLLLTPAWKIEAAQTSAILSYSLNPSFTLPAGQTSVTLNHVVLMLYLDPSGGKAASCLSKPVGAFDKNKNVIYWQLGNVTLTSTPQKLLARFATPDAEAKQGHVEAKWEMMVSGPAAADAVKVEIREDAKEDGDDPFADEDAVAAKSAYWKHVDGVRKVVAGTYSSK